MGGFASGHRRAPPVRLRTAGALSIGLWLSVIVCGRMLGFVD